MIPDLPRSTRDDRFARFAHELRTPLHALLGMAQLLRATPLDGDARDYAATIEEAARALAGLVDETLRAEAEGRAAPAAPAARTCAVRDVVASVVRLFAPAAEAKGLALGAEVDPAVPALVALHGGRVRQLLVNLVANAMKYTATGHVRVRVSIAASPGAASPLLRVEVEDSGPGIAPELRTRVFEPWVRGDGAASQDGVGLGLAVCRELARELGGRVEVLEAPRGGCVFAFIVPAPPVRATATSAPRAGDAAEPPRRAARVLLVEDDAVGRHVATRMLERLGASVVVAERGADALDALERTRLGDPPFDVVLLDCHLADGDGADVAGAWRARERETGGRRVAIVALTGDVTAATVARCRAAGMDGHLVKPAPLDAMARLLDAVGSARTALDGHTAASRREPHEWDEALLDVATLSSLLRLGEDATFAPALVDAWAADAERRVVTIAAAHAVGDAAAVARAAHALEGSSANVGAAAVAARAGAVQRAAASGELAAVAADVASLAACVADTRRALSAAVSRAIRSRTPRVAFPLVGSVR